MNKMMRITLSFVLFLLVIGNFFKASGYQADEKCCIVTGAAETLEKAILNAKRAIIEKGLGEHVSSRSMSIDGQSVTNIATSFSEGYITDFKVLSKKVVDDGWEVTASGSITQKDGKALLDRYREIGKPRILIHFRETLDKKNIKTRDANASHLLASKLAEFEIVDWNDLDQKISRQANKSKNLFRNDSVRQDLVQKLALNNAEILILGVCEITTQVMPMNPDMRSIQSVVRYKMVDISTNRILASDVATGTYPHINIRQGSKKAVNKAVEIIHPKMISQISQNWKSGGLIVFKIYGISYPNFQKKDIAGSLRTIPGVSNITNRGHNSNGNIQLDINALLSAPRMYASVKEVFVSKGLRIIQAFVKGNSITLRVR